MGFESGVLYEKYLELLSDGLRVGKCNQGDDWLQCSHTSCNQLELGGNCRNGGNCRKGQKAAISIACYGPGMYINIFLRM